tara:strand:+ start:649 stop:771 length:123 start_codon:yes stop_codon:yes gene_type:complete
MDYEILTEMVIAGSIFISSISYFYYICCRRIRGDIQEPPI